MLNRITDATSEPVTLGDVKASLILAGADDDALINGYIKTARQLVENFAHISLLAQTWELSIPLSALTTPIIGLPRPPIQSITSVKYVDTSGVEHEFNKDGYFADAPNECVRLKNGYGWVTEDVAYYKIQYVAGYATVGVIADGFKRAIVLTAHHLYEHRNEFKVPDAAIALIPERRRLF